MPKPTARRLTGGDLRAGESDMAALYRQAAPHDRFGQQTGLVQAIVVGGAGAMGHIVVRDLARSPGVELVTVADLDKERAVQIAAATATESVGAEIRSAAANVTDPSFPDLLSGHDVC